MPDAAPALMRLESPLGDTLLFKRLHAVEALGQPYSFDVEALSTDPLVRISTLAEKFAVSTETVRRDIEDLSARGMVRRTYGGASASHPAIQPGLSERDVVQLAPDEHQEQGRAEEREPERSGHAPLPSDQAADAGAHHEAAEHADEVDAPDPALQLGRDGALAHRDRGGVPD